MQTFTGYKIVSKIYESNRSMVFRAKGQETGAVILKVLKHENPTKEEIECFYYEYNLTRSLNSLTGVINTQGLEWDGKRLIMQMEDFGATSLDKLLNKNKFSLEQVLDIGIAVIEALDEIHCASLVHKNINPANIVMNPDSGRVKLIDFGIAAALDSKKNFFQTSGLPEGTLAYIPPEQTGRIDRPIDHRADFYSFGATLYELLAHKPPFNEFDHMDLIHCHLAKEPFPLSGVRPDIPEPVSKIVSKLMSKDAPKRYATANGVRVDLQRCLDWIKNGDQTFLFPIGCEDRDRFLKIPEKLFGRKKEREQLQESFQRVAAGKKEIVFVKGPAGIGKTLLAKDIEQAVLKNNGLFISGKFDLLQQSIPYTGFLQAFRQLARHLMTRSYSELNKWKKKLATAIGNQGYEILVLVPEFKKILESQPPLSKLGGHEARNRFYLILENFIGVFAGQQKPLVLFLDDLQWADPSSLELILQLMSSPVIDFMMIIGAFRDNEVALEHPLSTLLKKITKQGIAFQSIRLCPLEVSPVVQLLVEYLACSPSQALPLAQYIQTRSLGNPFHSKELLAALDDQKKFVYDPVRNSWTFDLIEIQALVLPENITKLLAQKVQGLSASTRHLLIRAACIGARFELSTFTIVSELSRDETIKALEEARASGLILQIEDRFQSIPTDQRPDKDIIYKFVHDRVHSMAYHLLPPEKKPQLHQQIGRLLMRKLGENQKNHRLFEIINHLNKGRILLTYGPERHELAGYNLEAAQKAKASTAFDQAYTYFMIGIDLMESPSDLNRESKTRCGHWQESYELISMLYIGAIETAFLTARFDEVEQLGQILLNHAATVLDQLRVYRIKAQAWQAQNKMTEATATALQGLGAAGIRFPRKPGIRHILIEYLKTRFLLSKRSLHRLDAIETTVNSEKIASVKILQDLSISLGFANNAHFHKNLLPLTFFKGIRLCILYGNTKDRAIGFAGYAFVLSIKRENLKTAYRFARKAIDLAESLGTDQFYARIVTAPASTSLHWGKHLKKTLPYLSKAHEKGLKSGDFDYAAIAAHIGSTHLFCTGGSLDSVQKKCEAWQTALQRIKQKTFHHYQNILLQAIHNLRGKARHPHELTGTFYDETTMIPIHKQSNDAGALSTCYVLKAMLCFLFNRPEDAVECLKTSEKHLLNQLGGILSVQYYFYDSLARLNAISPSSPRKNRSYFRKIREKMKKLKKWARIAPMNFEHKFLLVQAEYHRFRSRPKKAAMDYDLAISGARKNGYIQDAAIAGELAGRFYLSANNPDRAGEYLKQAWHDYFTWGATAKLVHLEACFPDIFPAPGKGVKPGVYSYVRPTGHPPLESFDWHAVLEAAVSISSEIHFGKLMEKLMPLVIKNTGAQKGILFLREGHQLKEAAVYPAAHEKAVLAIPIDPDHNSQVPRSIIRYVDRMKESIILDNEQNDPLFKNDPYILAQHPKSVLCFPLQYKSETMGVFYLENNLVEKAFTSHSLEILKILSAQISTSLENARLYRDLDGQTQKLKQEIELRCRIEAELKSHQDKLKNDLNAQAMELLESRQILAKMTDGSSLCQRFGNIIGKNNHMQKIYEQIKDLSDVNSNVLITGESGTGKELVADALHYSGERRNHEFIKVNCSGLAESLLESELFGHVKGAFTGAEKNKIGRFQKAGKGSILLDEIGDVTLHFQKRLLRILQEREFEQLGDTKTIQMEARIIAATNKNLDEKVADKSFREDLYYRLKVMEIKVPALRKRKEDIPLLVNHFLLEFNREMSKNIIKISEDVYEILLSYNWPGNVRELKNVIEHTVVTCKGSVLTRDNLPQGFNLMHKAIKSALSEEIDTREELIQILKKTKWNKTKAAKLMGVSRRTLYRKLEQHSIHSR